MLFCIYIRKGIPYDFEEDKVCQENEENLLFDEEKKKKKKVRKLTRNMQKKNKKIMMLDAICALQDVYLHKQDVPHLVACEVIKSSTPSSSRLVKYAG
ncbi:unnamed protein product [Prunus brigantina]